MIHFNRDILLAQRDGERHGETLEKELQCLHDILQRVETPEMFCRVHELVDRNRITRKPGKILRETKYYRLRAFRFLINCN